MYLVYLFREKNSGDVIYVGSSSRPAARMKEHMAALRGEKNMQAIHKYMIANKLELYKDVEVVWYDIAEDKGSMEKLEEDAYVKYVGTGKLLNSHPGADVSGDNNPRRRGVVNEVDGKTFKTVLSASTYYGIPRTTFTHYLSGSRKQPTINGVQQNFKYITINV